MRIYIGNKPAIAIKNKQFVDFIVKMFKIWNEYSATEWQELNEKTWNEASIEERWQ